MVQASNFGGKKICARKMEFAFKDAREANKDGQCTNDQLLCPENPDNASNKFKICIPKSAGTCPITSIHFKKKSDPNDTPGFEYISFNQLYNLGFSKSFDSHPITEFQVTPDIPCLSDIAPRRKVTNGSDKSILT